MIGDVAQSRWTLRFRDPALERAYRNDLALQVRGQVTTVLGVIVLALLAGAAVDPDVCGSPGNVRVITGFRLGLAAPAVALAALAHWRLPRAAYLRWRTAVVVLAMLSTTLFMVLSQVFVPDPEVAPVTAAFETWIIGQFVFLLLVGLDVVVAFAAIVGPAVSFLVICAARYPQVQSSSYFDAVLSLVVAVLGGYLLERSRRQTFLANTRADRLLENVMPSSIAERLKHGERRIAEHFDEATVLFADLVGFTAIAEKMPPGELVDTLDDVFSTFDDLAEKHGLEKIKTIGDAYMVVGGVPTARKDHAQAVAAMALEMRDAVAARGGAWQIRIGIHTGPVVAGVIGKRKFIYDLWGDTVNLASRMESHGVAGAIQVSGTTAAALDGAFVLEPRGPIAIKGKGELPAYLLSGTVPP